MNNNSDIAAKHDIDPAETLEWMQALEAVIDKEGSERASFLIETLLTTARQAGMDIPFSANTP